MKLSTETSDRMDLVFQWDPQVKTVFNPVNGESEKNELNTFFDYLNNFENGDAIAEIKHNHSEKVFVL